MLSLREGACVNKLTDLLPLARTTLQVDQTGAWRFLIFRGSFTVRMIVEQRASDRTVCVYVCVCVCMRRAPCPAGGWCLPSWCSLLQLHKRMDVLCKSSAVWQLWASCGDDQRTAAAYHVHRHARRQALLASPCAPLAQTRRHACCCLCFLHSCAQISFRLAKPGFMRQFNGTWTIAPYDNASLDEMVNRHRPSALHRLQVRGTG